VLGGGPSHPVAGACRRDVFDLIHANDFNEVPMRRRPVSFVLIPMILALFACESPESGEGGPAAESRVPATGADAPATQAGDAPAAATPDTPEPPPVPVNLDLTDAQRAALIQEMTMIESAMKDLVTALARGQAERAAELGEGIHDGFILAQALEREVLRDLVRRLPDDFRARDRDFHRSGRRLAEAARTGDFAEAARIHGEMTRACVSCHALYATDRFPALMPAR
jgi:hypothetical protein